MISSSISASLRSPVLHSLRSLRGRNGMEEAKWPTSRRSAVGNEGAPEDRRLVTSFTNHSRPIRPSGVPPGRTVMVNGEWKAERQGTTERGKGTNQESDRHEDSRAKTISYGKTRHDRFHRPVPLPSGSFRLPSCGHSSCRYPPEASVSRRRVGRPGNGVIKERPNRVTTRQGEQHQK